jgi:hypothetical protein
VSRRDDPVAPSFDQHPDLCRPGLTKFEATVNAVIASGEVMPPWKRPRPDGGPTPDQQYARCVLLLANAVWDEMETS